MFRWFESEKKSSGTPAAKADGLENESESGGFTSLTSALALTGRSLLGKVFGTNSEKAAGGVAVASDADAGDTLSFETADDFTDALDDLEEALIRADVGPGTAADITDRLRDRRSELRTPLALRNALKQEFIAILKPLADETQLSDKPDALNIYLVTGVNGAGKTTLIGKLAHRYIKQGKTVVIGAGDTFRAAAGEQLETWAKRAGAEFVGMGNSKDPAAVIFEALKRAKETGADVALLDTAGRLQNKANLMAELQKVRRVIDQNMPEGAHLECLLVLDATTGQNGLSQASVFKESIGLDGVALTKLDSSARGGIVLTIAREHRLPVKLVGVGEGIEDLRDFDAEEFVDGLFGP